MQRELRLTRLVGGCIVLEGGRLVHTSAVVSEIDIFNASFDKRGHKQEGKLSAFVAKMEK